MTPQPARIVFIARPHFLAQSHFVMARPPVVMARPDRAICRAKVLVKMARSGRTMTKRCPAMTRAP